MTSVTSEAPPLESAAATPPAIAMRLTVDIKPTQTRL
jgi:hypothetical protein